MKANLNMDDSEFYRRYRGSFSGILRWAQLDDFWQVLTTKIDAGWYIYAIGESVPELCASTKDVTVFVEEINKLLRKEHRHDYCGVVYVDNIKDPEFVKIYDPDNLGVVCGYSDNPPIPGWILSLTKPELLDENTFMTQSRKRWWQRIF